MHPKARTKRMISHQVDGEVVLFDRETMEAHRLAATAAAVHALCDGSRSVDQIAHALGRHVDLAVDRDTVEQALAELREAGLLETPAGQMRRRDVLRKALSAAAVVPLVMTIPAPSVGAAASGTA